MTQGDRSDVARRSSESKFPPAHPAEPHPRKQRCYVLGQLLEVRLDLGLAGARVLITGGAGGLGAAIATAFVREAARVAIGFVGDGTPATDLAATLSSKGAAITVEADVRDPDAVAAMFGAVDTAWGGIDILINNAGIDGPRQSAWETDPEVWRNVVDINLGGAFLCAREALRRMVKARSGVIINTTSVHDTIAWSGYSAYAASKAGLSMLAKTLAQEAAPYGVRVLSIAPGAIQTSINESVWSSDAGRADLLAKIPLGRLGRPEEIAAMVVLLSSRAASYVTATTVYVDGGMTDYPSFAHGG